MPTHGRFYIIELMPEEAPCVFKLGFSTKLENRLWQHRTTCPTAKVVMSYPCPAEMEAAAIDFILRGVAGRRYGDEVFACEQEDVSWMWKRADAFFTTPTWTPLNVPLALREEAKAAWRAAKSLMRTEPLEWLDENEIAATLEISLHDTRRLMRGTYPGYRLYGCRFATTREGDERKAPRIEVLRVKAEMDARRQQDAS